MSCERSLAGAGLGQAVPAAAELWGDARKAHVPALGQPVPPQPWGCARRGEQSRGSCLRGLIRLCFLFFRSIEI